MQSGMQSDDSNEHGEPVLIESTAVDDGLAAMRRQIAAANHRAAVAELEARAWKAECERIKADWRERMRFEAAKAAMGGLLSENRIHERMKQLARDRGIPVREHVAETAVAQADALLAELEKPQAQEAPRE